MVVPVILCGLWIECLWKPISDWFLGFTRISSSARYSAFVRGIIGANLNFVAWRLQGKDRREQSLKELTLHLSNVYMPCRRTWILLFPEGGFLRKRREISRKFALKNDLPHLNHTTIPRVGAVQNVVATIGPSRAKLLVNGNSNSVSSSNARWVSVGIWRRIPGLMPAFPALFWFLAADWANNSLKWIVDLTIAYPNGNPLDILTIFMASAPPCNTVFHYRCYPISEVNPPTLPLFI